MNNFKKNRILPTLIIALGLLTLTTNTSCKKKQIEKKPAQEMVGDFTGVGTTDGGNTPFFNATVRVTEVSDTKVKIEPVGNNHFTAFEVEVVTNSSGDETAIASVDGSEFEVGYGNDGTTESLAIDNTTTGFSFAGTK